MSSIEGLVPIVVGVTGHRDLRREDQSKLSALVREVLSRIVEKDPTRPIVLLTPLAEGADTLVAEVALSLGARLVVALPFAREEYEREFEGEARATFRNLMDHPSVVRRIDLPTVGSAKHPLDPETRHVLQYALAGAYVAHHCDVLIALWNGAESDLIGGTAQIVRYRRTGSFALDPKLVACLAEAPEPFGIRQSLLDPPDVGPLYHIVTPRRSDPEPPRAFTYEYVVPEAYDDRPDERARYLSLLEDIDTRIRGFNHDAIASRERLAAMIARSATDLYPQNDETETENRSGFVRLPDGLAALRSSFALADAMAVSYRRAWQRLLLVLFSLIFVAAIAFTLFAHGFREGQTASRATIGAYVGILALADALFIFVRVRHWQDKHQDYRAVAEGLRVQFYWRVAGLPHSASDHYVRKQRDELTWIPHAVRACSISAPTLGDEGLEPVRVLWTEGQAEYYDTARARAQQHERWRHAGSGAFGLSLAIALAILWREAEASRPLHAVLILSIAVFLVHAGLDLFELFAGDNTFTDRSARVWDSVARAGGFVIAAGVALVLVNVPRWLDEPGWTPTEPAEWLLVALGVTTVAGALLHGHAQTRAYAEHARHYGRMAAVFRRASSRLRAILETGDAASGREMVIEVGKEALGDHGDWVMLHRERPIELPEAGG